MCAERNGWPRPMRRRFCRHSVADGRQPDESGRCVFRVLNHIIEAGVVTGHVIDASELAKPVVGLCERDSNGQAAASHGTSRASTALKPLAVCTSESNPRLSAHGPS
jgi:hypothetical protein